MKKKIYETKLSQDLENISKSFESLNSNFYVNEIIKLQKEKFKFKTFINIVKSFNQNPTTFKFLLDTQLSFFKHFRYLKSIKRIISSGVDIQLPIEMLRADQRLRNFLLSLGPPPNIKNCLIDLSRDSTVFGKYEFKIASHEKGSVQAEQARDFDSRLVLPKEARERIAHVNYLPFQMVGEIMKKPALMRQISPRDFEKFTAYLLEVLGFNNVILTPMSGDGGRDVLATKWINGIPLLFAFECKQYSEGRKIQIETLRSLLGVVSHSLTKVNIGVLVTTSYFTRAAQQFILSEASIDGKDFNDIVTWISEIKSEK